MSNLIIVVISIILVAVVAGMAIFYMNTMMNPSIAASRANMLISQSRQTMTSDTQYMLDKGLGDFNSFGPDIPAINNYTSGRINILNLDTSEWNGSALTVALDPTAIRHETCTALDSYPVIIMRSSCNTGNKNLVVYWMTSDSASGACNSSGGGVDFSSAANVNHPLVQMCLKLNALTTLPAGLTYAPSGLPYAVSTSTTCPAVTGGVEYDSGYAQPNYCYIETDGAFGANKAISYIFGN